MAIAPTVEPSEPRTRAIITATDPFTGFPSAGEFQGVAWERLADGSVAHAGGDPFTVAELIVLGDDLDPAAGVTAAAVDVMDIDLAKGAVWMRPDRRDLFARLRAERPVSRQFGVPFIPGSEDIAWWAVTRYDDVQFVSRHADAFSSGAGGTNIGDIPPEFAEFLGSIINMDAPRHTKLRRIISAGFTPRHLASVEDSVRDRARRIVDGLMEKDSCDVVAEISAPLPLQIICDMMGIPAEDEQRMLDLSNIILGFSDPEYVTSMAELLSAGGELFQYGLALAEARLDEPRDDIASALIHAEVDGERLTPAELGSFFVLLVAAGNETTRTAISHGIWALTQFPDQRQLWLSNIEGHGQTATEEIVRWATPVLHFRRTAMRDLELGGQQIAEGDRVVMIYESANRDADHFDHPDKFDITRATNDQLGFGGGGPHFCLGANLARREIRVMFEELLRRLPDLTVSAEPDLLRSSFIHGIKRMPATYTPS